MKRPKRTIIRVAPPKGSVFHMEAHVGETVSRYTPPNRPQPAPNTTHGSFRLEGEGSRSTRKFAADPKDVTETYHELIRPLNDDAFDVPPKEPQPVKWQDCREDGRRSSLKFKNWDDPAIRAKVRAFVIERTHALTNAQLRLGISKAASTREKRKLHGQSVEWSKHDRELLAISLEFGASGLTYSNRRRALDVERLMDSWIQLYPAWLCFELGIEYEQGVEAIVKARPPRGRMVRVNGERKWKRAVGRPRKPLRPKTYKPRRPKIYAGETNTANFVADAKVAETPVNTGDIAANSEIICALLSVEADDAINKLGPLPNPLQQRGSNEDANSVQ